MSKIILIRHGESESNVDKTILSYKPDHLIELTENGKNQAKQAAKSLPLKFAVTRFNFYCSPFVRAKQTAEIMLKQFSISYPIDEDIRLREMDIGNFIHDHKKIMEERLKHSRFFYRFPCGESCADVFVRVKQFLAEKTDEDMVIFTHAATMRVFQMIVSRLTVEQFDKLPKPKNCEILTLYT